MMVRNDYRRALILLRANQPGMNGHVRLERRTLMGSMQFTLSGLRTDTESLQAVMAAKVPAGWKLVYIGALGRDSRGQAGLNWTFDPRSIEGLPLEKYSVLLILESGAGGCRTLFTGYVNGSVSVDWEQLEQTACRQYAGTENRSEQSEERAGTEEEVQLDVDAAEEGEGEQNRCAEDDLDAPATSGEEIISPETEQSAEDASAMAVASAIPTEPLAAVYADPLDVPALHSRSAMAALGLDASLRWPEGIEPLREVFASGTPISLSAQPDHVFVKAEHVSDCPECAVGVRVENGALVSVAYAIPGEYAQQPPAGLEGYTWKDGYWTVVADAQTGEYLNI